VSPPAPVVHCVPLRLFFPCKNELVLSSMTKVLMQCSFCFVMA
jgi:hypothetical protein